MNETILIADGRVITVGDAGSVLQIIAEAVVAATIPAVRDPETGEITTPAIVPDADDLMLEMSRENMKTHVWRLPKARENRLGQIRGLRDDRLITLDREANDSTSGRPGQRPPPQIEQDRQALRDLPPVAEAHLATLMNTDDMDAYLPAELQ